MQSCFLSFSLCMLCIAVLYHSVVIICFMLCICECLVSRVTMQSIICGLLYQCNVVCLCVCLLTLLVVPVVWHSQTDPVSVRVGLANGVELFSLKVWYICRSFPLRGDWFLLLPAVVVVIVLNTDCWCLRLILYIMLAVPWQFFHFLFIPHCTVCGVLITYFWHYFCPFLWFICSAAYSLPFSWLQTLPGSARLA